MVNFVNNNLNAKHVLIGDESVQPKQHNQQHAMGTTIKFIKIEPGTMILKWS